MSYITEIVGDRLRTRRKKLNWSQEYVAEQAGLHPTYIGQVERGEKNVTIESLLKICTTLHYPMDELFRHVLPAEETSKTVANECFEIINQQSYQDQQKLLAILKNIIEYKQ